MWPRRQVSCYCALAQSLSTHPSHLGCGQSAEPDMVGRSGVGGAGDSAISPKPPNDGDLHGHRSLLERQGVKGRAQSQNTGKLN